MSYDIHLEDKNGQRIEIETHQRHGGTYALGGTSEAWLNITYNYSQFYRQYLDAEKGIRVLYGKRVVESIPLIEKAIAALGTERSSDYWEPTPGNAGAALNDLLEIARMAGPDAVFQGD